MNTIYRDALAGIRDNLADGADILIYEAAILVPAKKVPAAAALLSELTGADIASSDDDTGSAELGGDWDLEQSVGSVETAGVFAPRLRRTSRLAGGDTCQRQLGNGNHAGPDHHGQRRYHHQRDVGR